MQAGHGNAICYSGYREGQSPQAGVFPGYAEVSEDLNILANNWKFLRLYDCSPHAETVLEVISKEGLDFKVMLGMDLAAEVSNPHCPWGAEFSDETLTANQQANYSQSEKLIELANRYAPERAGPPPERNGGRATAHDPFRLVCRAGSHDDQR